MSPMDGSSQGTEPSIAVNLGSTDFKVGTPTNDQRFLLYFIMGTYFGPDIKGERNQKSVLQRIAEGLPPYTSDQLASSNLKTVEVERVYYYVLRKADESVIVKLPLLHQFFQGNISAPVQEDAPSYPQFTDLFPPELHPQSQFKNQYKIIENIVCINNPETAYIKPDDIERFKRLSGLEDFKLDRNATGLRTSADGDIQNNLTVREADPDGGMPPHQSCSSSRETRYKDDSSELSDSLQHVHVLAPSSRVPCNGTNMMYSYMAPLPSQNDTDAERVGPAMIYLPSYPTKKEWSDIVAATKNGFALTGSATLGQVGPIVGLMDIGECEDSYLFRVSLPGVKRDNKDFSCEVDPDGTVLIRGVTTTGEKMVYRYSQVFEMQTQNLCPSGHFSISFQLPGPIDPHQFSGNFGTDGILEGIVMKAVQTR